VGGLNAKLALQMMMGRSSMQVAPPDLPGSPPDLTASPREILPPNLPESPRISPDLPDRSPQASPRPPAFPVFHPHPPRISGPPESEICSYRFLVVSDFGCRYRADRG
jgi:hypothetical protein